MENCPVLSSASRGCCDAGRTRPCMRGRGSTRATSFPARHPAIPGEYLRPDRALRNRRILHSAPHLGKWMESSHPKQSSREGAVCVSPVTPPWQQPSEVPASQTPQAIRPRACRSASGLSRRASHRCFHRRSRTLRGPQALRLKRAPQEEGGSCCGLVALG